MKTRIWTLSLPLTLVAIAGCPSDDSDPTTGADDDASDSDTEADDDASDDDASDDDASDASSDEGDTEQPAGCPEPTSGPTHHDEDVVGHEVWTADASPHIVDWTVDVVDGGTLEIEPCAVVQFAEGHSLNVAYPGTPTTGTLVAEGTEDEPIRFEGLDGARWGHLFVNSGGTASLAHVTIAGGGGAHNLGASLVVSGNNTLPVQTPLFVDHVTIVDSFGIGALVDTMARFADGSTDLVITESGNEDNPYPLVVTEHALDAIPRGDYTGNVVDKIRVLPRMAIAEDTTMRELGVPYLAGDGPSSLRVASGDENAPATLTIEPGVRIEFTAATALEVEHFTGEFMASGTLVALGTAAAPITFTSAAENPQPGDWQGLWFGGIVQPATQLQHVRIEYTGAWCGCILLTCSDIDEFEGAVIMSMQPDHVFVTDSVIAHGSMHGFVLGYDGDPLDFASVNSFEGMAGCAMTQPRYGACPNPLPSCME